MCCGARLCWIKGTKINSPPAIKGPNIKIPLTVLIKGRGVINQGSGSMM